MGPSPQAENPVGAAKPALCILPWAPSLSPAASQLSFKTGKTAGKGSPPSLQHGDWSLLLTEHELSSREGSSQLSPHYTEYFLSIPCSGKAQDAFSHFPVGKKLLKNKSNFKKWGKLDYFLLEISQGGLQISPLWVVLT